MAVVTGFAPLQNEVRNGKKHNFGNKTGRVCYSIGIGNTAQAQAYGFEERENRNQPGGEPLLYFMCEYNGKKGFAVKCNDEDYIQTILNNSKDRYTVSFLVREFEIDGRKTVFPEMTGIS